MKKMILSVTLVTLLALFSTTISATAVTMYATDGRTAEVDSTKIAAYKNAGWYENKADAFTLLYTTDGRIKYVPNDNVSKHINLGWQKKYTELNLTQKIEEALYGYGVLKVSGPEKIKYGSYNYYSSNYNIIKDVKTIYITRNVKYIGNYAFEDHPNLSRVEILHLKDAVLVEEDGEIKLSSTSVGEGSLDIPAILKACEQAGTEYIIVEQSSLPDFSLDGVKASRDYLKSLGL